MTKLCVCNADVKQKLIKTEFETPYFKYFLIINQKLIAG